MIGVAAIRNYEAGKAEPDYYTLESMQRTFEFEGVIFIESDEEGPGVRIRKRSADNESTFYGSF
jgi:hypothetical protein